MTIEATLPHGLKTSAFGSQYKTEYDANLALLDPDRITSGPLAGRPAAGLAKRFYFATDTGALYYDNGAAWMLSAVQTATHAGTHASGGADAITLAQSQVTNLSADLAAKEPANANIQAHIASAANPHAVTKSQVGLGNADNTGDANKPVSTAQQAALDLKQDVSGKDASGGYAGLTLFKLNLKNAANTFTNFFTNATTAARTWTFPDKDGTVAMTSDITGTNSGTNTGDQTISDATISTTDITTNNVSITKHGFAPKAPNIATQYLDGTGAYSTPTGMVLQVVSTTKTDTSTITSATFAAVTGLSATITPRSTSSKILVLFNLAAVGTADQTWMQLQRGTTGIAIGDAAGSRIRASGVNHCANGSATDMKVSAGSYLDSPATTSAITYQIAVRAASGSVQVNLTKDDTDATAFCRAASTITLMEIA